MELRHGVRKVLAIAILCVTTLAGGTIFFRLTWVPLVDTREHRGDYIHGFIDLITNSGICFREAVATVIGAILGCIVGVPFARRVVANSNEPGKVWTVFPRRD